MTEKDIAVYNIDNKNDKPKQRNLQGGSKNDLDFLTDIAENKTGLYNMITEELGLDENLNAANNELEADYNEVIGENNYLEDKNYELREEIDRLEEENEELRNRIND